MRGSLHGCLGLWLGLAACSFDAGGVSDDDVDARGPGTDSDEDGVDDDVDNCDDVENPDQRDEDGDDVGNPCDRCPHVADDAQPDDDGDGVGDACDPQPSIAGNTLLYFEGFDDPGALDDWRVFNGGEWSIRDGALYQADPTGFHTLYLGTQSFQSIQVDSRFVLDVAAPSSGPSDSNRAFASLIGFSTAPGEGAAYICLAYSNPAMVAPSGSLNLIALRGASPYLHPGAVALNANLMQGGSYELRHALDANAGDLACDVRSSSLPADVAVSGNDDTFTQGLVGLKTQDVAAHIDYVAVFSLVD